MESNRIRVVLFIILTGAVSIMINCNMLQKKIPGNNKKSIRNLEEYPSVILLRMHGSSTIGSVLAPELVKTWLGTKNPDTVFIESGSTIAEKMVKAFINDTLRIVVIHSYGSNTGFDGLAWNRCDIAMSSKPIDRQNCNTLRNIGDMTSYACEHVLGIDGIAVLVNKINVLEKLPIETIAKIYQGKITRWTQLDERLAGSIHVYCRDHNSGTFWMFNDMVMERNSIKNDAIIVKDNNAMSASIEKDPFAIGFAGVTFVNNNKALSIASGDADAYYPTKFNISVEDYPLSRRLYLYTAQNPVNQQVRAFIEWALSDEGQTVVERSGFMAQILRLAHIDKITELPYEYENEISNALRLSLNFRFKINSFDLDSRAQRDCSRLATFINQENLNHCTMKLFGFTDNTGDAVYNAILSKKRAEVIATILNTYGITPQIIKGFGEDNPVATNKSPEGRHRNRRVEVWFSCS